LSEEKARVRIENWSVGEDADPYTPPECKRPLLQGEVFGHPSFPDGTFIRTSSIVSASPDGTLVRTRNNEYVLGAVQPEYREWLRINRPEWNEKHPFTTLV
jgi:hypothetical protein